MEWKLEQLDDLPRVAQEVLEYCHSHYFFVFYGEMGTGKTTFIKQLCKQLGAEGDLASPTYSLVNEYALPPGNNKQRIYHMDLYRLERIEEALDVGMEDYFDDTAAWCLIEWPELVEPLLPDDVVTVKMERTTGQTRLITVELPLTNS